MVAAAVLSNRYITDRFLPDKAIDLVDEAAARLRTEIDSMPTELDEIQRRIMQLEIEREALKKESDAASKDRLAEARKGIGRAENRSPTPAGSVEDGKGSGAASSRHSRADGPGQDQIEQAERAYDLNKAAELKYGKLIELERQLQQKKSGGRQTDGNAAATEGRSR